MVPEIPRSGSGSPCEATSNSLCHGISLCALKQQICVSLKRFRCELAVVPEAQTALHVETQESEEEEKTKQNNGNELTVLLTGRSGGRV